MLVGYSLLKLLLWLDARNFDCFPNHNSHPQKKVNHQRCLGNHGLPCFWCHLLPQPVCWEWAFVCSGLWLTALSFFLPLWKHPIPCPASTLQYHMQQWGSSLPLSFHGDILAPLPLFSFPQQLLQWFGDLPVQYLWSPLPVPSYQPNWWGSLSRILCLWHFPRGVLPCMITIQRIALFPQGQLLPPWYSALQDHLEKCPQLMNHSMHGKGGADCLPLPPKSF